MPNQDLYASFFIRLWRSGKKALADQDRKMIFEIEHIQSGKIQHLNTPEEFLAFITSLTINSEANN